MNARQRLKHGNEFPYDAHDAWWENSERPLVVPDSKAHRTARGVIADLQDRRGIKNGFADVDEETRREIVNALAAIIEEGMR